jgi:hypothetical protein
MDDMYMCERETHENVHACLVGGGGRVSWLPEPEFLNF